MLEVTEPARTHLSWILSQGKLRGVAAMRIVVEEDSFGLRVDTPNEEDQVFHHQGEPVLVVDRKLDAALGERRLDLESRPDGDTLTLIG